jgi:hypothetical protein
MKPLTGSDSSILAYLASASDISAHERKRLISQLSPAAREIASALKKEHKNRKKRSFGRARVRAADSATRTARALVSWA